MFEFSESDKEKLLNYLKPVCRVRADAFPGYGKNAPGREPFYLWLRGIIYDEVTDYLSDHILVTTVEEEQKIYKIAKRYANPKYSDFRNIHNFVISNLSETALDKWTHTELFENPNCSKKNTEK